MKHWLQAFRLRTLPLALSSIGMGSFLAAAIGRFSWLIFGLCAATTVFLQILSNLANDYGDSVNGADHNERQGPARAVQSGVISLSRMRAAIGVFILLSLLTGLALLYVVFGVQWEAFLFFFAVGIGAILAAIAYTAGRKPYGYIGLGDLSVFTFFGLVGVVGCFYLYTQQLNAYVFLPAISCGLFSVAVLNINNIRDIESDLQAGKFSIPVRIGRQAAVRYHMLLLAVALLSAVAFTLLSYTRWSQWLYLAVIPLLISNIRAVMSKHEAHQLDPYLKQMALTTLLFVVLFGVGLMMAS